MRKTITARYLGGGSAMSLIFLGLASIQRVILDVPFQLGFVVIPSIAGFTVGMAITHYFLKVQQLNESLEAQVQERTQELDEKNKQLEALSNTDGLTGVRNRRYFDTRLKEACYAASRSKDGTALSLIMCDIDFFKGFNDAYGHLAGDACLKSAAEAIKGALRRPTDFVARYGGEEFAIVLPMANSEVAHQLAEVIRMAVVELKIPHRESSHGVVTLSLGVASLNLKGAEDSPTSLIQAADEQLYEAKESGRNAVRPAQRKVAITGS